MGSKRYKKALEMVDIEKKYEIDEAIEILKKFPKANFDETVELHTKLKQLVLILSV